MRAQTKEIIEDGLEELKEGLRIAVIYGGDRNKEGAVINPTFNPRSDKTYEYVADDIMGALREIGFKHVIKLPEDMHLGSQLQRHGINLCWLNSGGTQGACSVSHAPAVLEVLGLPYIGHNPLNAAILDSKHIFKSILVTMGIDTARFLVFDPKIESDTNLMTKRIDEAFSGYSGSYIAKPVSGRASQHVHHVADKRDLVDVVREIGNITQGQVMVEKFLGGREYTMASIGPLVWKDGALVDNVEPFAFSGCERRLEGDEKIFTSMDIKKITNDRVNLLSPTADREVLKAMEVTSKRIFSELNLSAGVRIDFRADSEGNIHVLEANPKPDLKRPTDNQISLVCAGLHQVQMTYTCLIRSMLLNKIHSLMTYQPQMAPKLMKLFRQAELA